MTPENKEPEAETTSDAASAEPAAASESEEPAEESLQDFEAALAAAEAKAQENWDRYLRAAAELDNYRRRAQRELENALKFGYENFAAEVLHIKDSLEMGLEALGNAAADPEKLKEGKEATLKLLNQILDRFGVAEIEPAGEAFNPELHEAMSMQETADHEPGSIIAVVQKGYTLHDRLLRPARVIVARAPEESQTATPAGANES